MIGLPYPLYSIATTPIFQLATKNKIEKKKRAATVTVAGSPSLKAGKVVTDAVKNSFSNPVLESGVSQEFFFNGIGDKSRLDQHRRHYSIAQNRKICFSYPQVLAANGCYQSALNRRSQALAFFPLLSQASTRRRIKIGGCTGGTGAVRSIGMDTYKNISTQFIGIIARSAKR